MKYIPEENTTSNSQTSEFNYSEGGDYRSMPDSFIFAIHKDTSFNVISGAINPFVENIFGLLKNNSEKEMLYLTAIENLLKQKEYLALFYQASQNLITNEEFNEELEKNEHKYLIKIDDKIEANKLNILSNIVSKIKFELSEDDISEIFSMNHNVISNFLESKNKNENCLR